jgi:hypothetical protein
MTTSTRSRISADDHDCELARTIREFADASLIVKQCANRLGVHVNTVYHGLNRVGRITGTDSRTYARIWSLTTALTIASQHGLPRIAQPRPQQLASAAVTSAMIPLHVPASIAPGIPNGASPVDAQFV